MSGPSMDDLPEAVRELYAGLQRLSGEDGVLFLSLDQRYCVRDWLGDPVPFGLGDLLPGLDVRIAAPYLDHFEGAGRLTLPFVNLGEDRAVHLHVLPREEGEGIVGSGWYVLFAAADDELVRQRRQQQQENEARVRTQRLQGRLVDATTQGQYWRDQARQAKADTWRLAGMLSHELRTPLSAIAGYARLLEQGLAHNSDLSHQAKVIGRSAAQIAHLIESTLEQYRREGEELSVTPRPTDVRALVSQLTELLAPLAADKALGFAAFVVPWMPPRLYIDGSRLRQVMLNLLGNAVKYTEEGWVRLDVDWDRDAHLLEVAVTDSGPGIASEQRERIFAAFDRAGRGDDTPGTGLGLHISRLIASRLGGSLALAPPPAAGGARFTLTVPAEPLDVAAAEAFATQDVTPGRVVIGEDDPDLAALFTIFLERAGFQPSAHTRAEAVMERVAADAPQLVLLDLHLDDGDSGLTVASELRDRGYTGALVAMSASGASRRDDALRAGCDDYVVKPIPPEDLIALLFEVLRRHTRSEGIDPPVSPAD